MVFSKVIRHKRDFFEKQLLKIQDAFCICHVISDKRYWESRFLTSLSLLVWPVVTNLQRMKLHEDEIQILLWRSSTGEKGCRRQVACREVCCSAGLLTAFEIPFTYMNNDLMTINQLGKQCWEKYAHGTKGPRSLKPKNLKKVSPWERSAYFPYLGLQCQQRYCLYKICFLPSSFSLLPLSSCNIHCALYNISDTYTV